MRHPWRLVPAPMLMAQAPVPDVAFTQDEWRTLPPAELGRRLVGSEGARVTHHRHCTMVEGTGCNGFGPGTIILSTDFRSSGFENLCAARQWTAYDQLPREAGRVQLAPPVRSTAFRIGTSCRGQASRYTHAGEFTIFKTGAPATAADAWKVLQTARQSREALRRHAVPVDCRPDPNVPTDLCDDPADALGEAKLGKIYRVVINQRPAGKDVLRLELWGHDPKRNNATYLWVNLDLARDFNKPGPVTIRRVTIEEHPFVD